MTLTNRLSWFFLAALAVVLGGFSATLFAAAHVYLHREAADRARAMLDMLVAAAEVNAAGVEWEPSERRLSPGAAGEPDGARWLVQNHAGERVDSSDPGGLSDLARPDLAAGDGFVDVTDDAGRTWRVVRQRLEATGGQLSAAERAEPMVRKYPALVVTAAVPLGPVGATLRNLAGILAGVSLGLWLVAWLVGRRVCRRALSPLTRMAGAARDMGAELGERLPGSGADDELDDLARAFNGLLDRLGESFDRQRRFTAEASHQLRTPLTAMLGQAEVALRRERPAEEYRRVVGLMQNEAKRLRTIVDSLLFLAQADGDADPPKTEPLALGAWLQSHLAGWASHPRAADLRLSRPPCDPAAEVHPLLLGQVVDCLLENACKYSPAGSPVQLHVGCHGADALLEVEDRGFGIAADDLPNLFRPFFRSADARRRGVAGVGLGLAIADRIARVMRGSLVARRCDHGGTCFTLRLPKADLGADVPGEESRPGGSADEAARPPQAVRPAVGAPS